MTRNDLWKKFPHPLRPIVRAARLEDDVADLMAQVRALQDRNQRLHAINQQLMADRSDVWSDGYRQGQADRDADIQRIAEEQRRLAEVMRLRNQVIASMPGQPDRSVR